MLALCALAACSTDIDVVPTVPPNEVVVSGSAGTLTRRPSPADNARNTDVSLAPVDANSTTLIAACGIRNLQYPIPPTASATHA